MNQNDNLTQNEFSLADLFYIIKNGFRPIIIVTLLFGILFGVYAFSIADETYESNIDVYITPITSSDGSTTNDYAMARYLIVTIAEYMESNSVVESVIEKVGLNETSGSFKSKLTVTASTDSYRINVAYEDTDPGKTKNVVNELVKTAIDMQKDEESSEKFLPDNISIVGVYATEDGTYASPNKPLLIIIGLFIGGVIGLAIAFIMELLNNSFKTKEQLENAFDIQVLGIIPEFEIKEDF